MVGVAFTDVFNPEVVDDEPKNNSAPFVAPESGSCGGFILTRFVEADAQNIIFQFASLWHALSSSENFEIYPSIAGAFSEVIFINELLRYI